MFAKAMTSLQSIGRFSEQDKILITQKLQAKTLKKNEIILKNGQTCRAVWFINQGAIRQFYVTNEGDECTLNFFTTGDWILDIDSFLGQKPSENTLIACENTEILELTVFDLHALIDHSQVFLQLGKILNAPKRPTLYDLSNVPEEKYKHLLQTKPHILQKFPLKQVASYLKMAPETLSRVRRKIKDT